MQNFVGSLEEYKSILSMSLDERNICFFSHKKGSTLFFDLNEVYQDDIFRPELSVKLKLAFKKVPENFETAMTLKDVLALKKAKKIKAKTEENGISINKLLAISNFN